ncbi:GNAT family N-acetyltransferase [Polaribacter sp.]|uniref:GNAT family N-acetyltransferase n=1 Tax=Polaribacter sp. TaxID=1920175 RepID=UPI0040474E78
MITYTQTKTLEELMQILALQKVNLLENLSVQEKQQQGFVTVKHTIDILKKMHEACPHTIAKFNDRVVGYALSMTKEFSNDIEVLKPMFLEIEKKQISKNYIVMGQICIDKEFRKNGIFRGLYNFMKTEICKGNFDDIVTEIDINNKVSLNAHQAVGFKNCVDYNYQGKTWRIVTLKV